MDLQKLRDRLKAAGLTQDHVAARLDRTRSQVSRMLSGKTRMRVETLAAIEALLAEAEGQPRKSGVSETPAAPFKHQVKFVSLEEARATRDAPRVRMTDEERAIWLRELRELGEAGRRMPRLTDMTDDEILGYDEVP